VAPNVRGAVARTVGGISAPVCGGLGQPKIDAEIERAILADLGRKDRPGVRVIAATHRVAVNTVRRIAHAQ
jgi:hypothetical protein